MTTSAKVGGIDRATDSGFHNSPEPPATVYDCIVAVSAALAQEGIAKTRNNQQQGYNFRGIDEVFNALSPLLAKARLVILPRVLSRSVTERVTQKGGVLFYVVIEAEFDFVSAADGSKHTVKTYGEAMDSADKATNKAMSAAYKYAAFQTFCIPTEGDNDADAHTPDAVVAVTPDVPEGYVPWLTTFEAIADSGTEPLHKAWQQSDRRFRDYLTKWGGGTEPIKARAALADKKAKPATNGKAVPA